MTAQPQAGAALVQQPQLRRRQQGLSFLVHGNAKVGKSTFADSGPVPRVVFDVEGSSTWTPSRKIEWDPTREQPPRWDGTWDTAIVMVREARDVASGYRWLSSGQHPFNSCTVDSLTEYQQRVIDQMVGTGQMKREDWGGMLRQLSSMARQFRDLIINPVKPLWAVTFVAGTKYDEKIAKWRPMVQGQSQDYLPYYVDVLGYLGAQQDGTRLIFIGPHPNYETGERLGGRLPNTMQIGDPSHPGYTAESMLAQVLQG